MDNLDADIQHANEILRGAIHSLSVSCCSKTILCHDAKHPEVKVVDMCTGKAVGALMQGKDVQAVTRVLFCLKGLFAITRNRRQVNEDEDEFKYINNYDDDDDMEIPKPDIKWDLLTDDTVWHVETRKVIFKAEYCRYLTLNLHETAIGFVRCTSYNPDDWTNNVYCFTMWKPTTVFLNGEVKGESVEVDLPDMSELIASPVLHSDERACSDNFLALLQRCVKKFHGGISTESARIYENVLFIQNFVNGKSVDSKLLKIHDLLRYANTKDRMAHISVVHGNVVLIGYVKDVDHFLFDNSTGLKQPVTAEKGYILFNPKNMSVVRHLLCTLSPTTDMSISLMSKTSSKLVDNDLKVYNLLTNRLICQIDADLDFSTTRLALDGNYLVSLSREGRSLYVHRTDDGTQLARLFIHGTATCLEVGEDQRSLVVGCKDGRVIILCLVLDCSDPYTDIISKIPSRLKPATNTGDKGVLIQHDVAVVQGQKPELIRLAEKIRTDVKVAVKRQASFKTITRAVIQQQRQHKSQACVVQ